MCTLKDKQKNKLKRSQVLIVKKAYTFLRCTKLDTSNWLTEIIALVIRLLVSNKAGLCILPHKYILKKIRMAGAYECMKMASKKLNKNYKNPKNNTILKTG